MKKDEILEKARAEKSDELEQHVQDKSMIWIIVAMFLCMTAFSFTRLERGESVEDYAATLAIAASVGNFYRYHKMKKLQNKVIGIVFAAVGLFWAILYFVKYFGV